MNDGVVIIAALAGEVKPMVHRWAALGTSNSVHGWRHPSAAIFALYGGVGANAAMRAFARAREVCMPTSILSVGWVGALRAGMEAGSVIRPAMVRDLRTGENFACSSGDGLLLSSSRVATREEKERLARTYDGSVAVDMEAATLARLAAAHGLPFQAIKAVSDTFEENLPDMNPFVKSDGQFATARFIAFAAARPKYWVTLAQFGKQASVAAENLCTALQQDLGLE